MIVNERPSGNSGRLVGEMFSDPKQNTERVRTAAGRVRADYVPHPIRGTGGMQRREAREREDRPLPEPRRAGGRRGEAFFSPAARNDLLLTYRDALVNQETTGKKTDHDYEAVLIRKWPFPDKRDQGSAISGSAKTIKKMNQGKIVEYIDQGKFVCAVCLQDKGTRLHLLTASNREVNFSPKRSILISEAAMDIDRTKQEVIENLRQAEAKRIELKEQVDVREIWELIRDEAEDFNHRYLAPTGLWGVHRRRTRVRPGSGFVR